MSKATYPQVHHFLVDLSESEHQFDVDYPKIREELGYDPRCFRPLAVIATLGLMRDERLGALCNSPAKARQEIFEMTLGVVRNLDSMPAFPNYKHSHLDLICRYISYAVVDIASTLHFRIRDKLALERMGAVSLSMSPSMYYQPIDNKDVVAIQFEVKLKQAARYPFEIATVDEQESPWKGELKW